MSELRHATIICNPNCAQLRIFAKVMLALAPELRPVFSALRGPNFAFCFPGRDQIFDLDELHSLRCPMLVTIVDSGRSATGPGDWPCAPALGNWAHNSHVSTRSLNRRAFEWGVMVSRTFGRVVLVGTTGRHAPAWSTLFRYEASNVPAATGDRG
jgi:hypothetical protein